jgi:signal transduction histidine kinase
MSTTIDVHRSVGRPSWNPGPSVVTDDTDGGLFALIRRTVHARPLLVDALLALVILAFSTVWLASSPFAGRTAALLQLALIVPLVWRRRHPSAVFVVVGGVALVQLLLGYQLLGDAAVLVALYTVAVHESRSRALAAAGVLEVGALVASLRWEPAGTVPRSLLFLTATVVAALFAGLTVASGSRYLAWLAERAERLEVERDQQAVIAATAERTRIAREMHDIVSHSLSVVITLADAASVVSRTDPDRAADTMAQVSEIGRNALGDMRAMIGVLRTSDSAVDLAPQPDLVQLGALLDRVRSTGLDVECTTIGPPVPLSAAAELTLYRVVQESLTNTLKHGRADRARVTMTYGRSSVEVRVEDSGAGGGPGATPAGSTTVSSSTASPSTVGPSTVGHGIEGMRERVALHGGSLQAGPVSEGGWMVVATLPVDPAPVVP